MKASVEMDNTALDVGVYDLATAERLIDVPRRRIKAWLTGRGLAHGAALWQPQHLPQGARIDVGFLDLMELRVVDALRASGCSIDTVMNLIALARRRYGGSHPFVTRKFQLFGRRIILHTPEVQAIASAEDVDDHQLVFLELVEVMNPTDMERMRLIWTTLEDVEYPDEQDDERVLWRPTSYRNLIVLDPSRNFGQPTIDRVGVPTAALSQAMLTCRSRAALHEGFGVTEEEIDVALELQERLERRKAA